MRVANGGCPLSLEENLPYKNPDDKRAWGQKWYRDNRERCKSRQDAFRETYYEGVSCCLCKNSPISFHHVDPATKLCQVSDMSTCSTDRVEKEIEKCVPLCKPCHQSWHRDMWHHEMGSE